MIDFFDSNLVLVQATFTGLLLAFSVQLPMRMGVFSFAGAGSYGLGAYTAAIITIRYDLGAIPAILVAAVGAAVIGLLLGLLIAHLSGLYLAMATVAFDLTVSVLVVNGGTLTGGPTGIFGVLSDLTLWHMAVITLAALILLAFSERGRLGRRVEAVRDDPELASSMGIKVRRYRLVAFVVSGALGGAAGAMHVLIRTTISPLDIGFGLIVLALTMIIVGGTRSWKGALIGALIFTWLPELLAMVGQWQELIYGVLVAVAAIFLPGGIYGLYTSTVRKMKQRRRPTIEEPGQADDHPQPLLEQGAAAQDDNRPVAVDGEVKP